MTWWQAAILGLVEGITEYLPVSSTGHLILASALMGLDDTPAQKGAVGAFNIVIQGGAILAVLGLYRERVGQMIMGLLGRNRAGLRLAVNLLIAFLPAAVLGPLLNDRIERWLFKPGPVIAALTLGGVFMIWVDRWRLRHMREDEKRHLATSDASPVEGRLELDDLTPQKALIIGLLQTIAMWPGTSRSMMTIVGGVLVGLRPSRAAEFSFLLGLPTLGGACAYTLYKDLTRDEGLSLFDVLGWQSALIGVVFATVSAALAVKWLVAYLNKHGLALFGWYRIALSLVLVALIGAGVVNISGPAEAEPEAKALERRGAAAGSTFAQGRELRGGSVAPVEGDMVGMQRDQLGWHVWHGQGEVQRRYESEGELRLARGKVSWRQPGRTDRLSTQLTACATCAAERHIPEVCATFSEARP